MIRHIVFLAFLALLAINNVSATKCYICDDTDCNSLTDEKLKTCTVDVFPDENQGGGEGENGGNQGGGEGGNQGGGEGGNQGGGEGGNGGNQGGSEGENGGNQGGEGGDENGGQTGDGNGDGKNPKSPQQSIMKFLNKYMQVKEGETEDNNFRCLTYNKDDKIHKGCTKRSCRTIEADYSGKNCHTCEEDKCNVANSIQSWALSTTVLFAVIKFYLN